MRLWKRKRNAAVDDLSNLDREGLIKEIESLKKQVESHEQRIEYLKDFVGEQYKINKIHNDSINRSLHILEMIRKGEKDESY